MCVCTYTVSLRLFNRLTTPMICFIWTVASTQDIILICDVLEEVSKAASSTSGRHLEKHLITPELTSENKN